MKNKEKKNLNIGTTLYEHVYKEDKHIKDDIEYYKHKFFNENTKIVDQAVLSEKFKGFRKNLVKRGRKKANWRSQTIVERLEKQVIKMEKIQIGGVIRELIPITKARIDLKKTLRVSSKDIRETLKNFKIESVGK